MDILGLITGIGGSRDPDKVEQIAAKKRGLSEENLNNVGKDFSDDDDKPQDTIKSKCRY